MNHNELRHQKYKRCLTMSLYCESLMREAFLANPEYVEWLDKWRERWLGLAEQFRRQNADKGISRLGDRVMCKYCDKPYKTIARHLLGVSAFVGAGHLILRFDDKQLNKVILSEAKISYCPMCGRKLTEDK